MIKLISGQFLDICLIINYLFFIAGVFPTINGAHVLLNPHDIRYMDTAEINIGEETLTLKQIADVKKNAMTLIYYKK